VCDKIIFLQLVITYYLTVYRLLMNTTTVYTVNIVVTCFFKFSTEFC